MEQQPQCSSYKGVLALRILQTIHIRVSQLRRRGAVLRAQQPNAKVRSSVAGNAMAGVVGS